MLLVKKVRIKHKASLFCLSNQKVDITIVEGLEKLDYDYLEPLNRLIVQAKNSKILAK